MRKMIRSCAAAALLTLLFCGIAAGAEEKTLTERMDAEAHRIMMQFKNASWRLEMDFKGMSAEQGEVATKLTPFQQCCSVNIKKIEGAMKALALIFKELDECYEQGDNESEKADLALVRTDLATFAKLIGQMSESASRDEAKAMSASATRAHIDFVESAEALDDCPKP
jgi:hypothetical protein